ncbi:MAG: hypothetical protein MJ234_06975 [bacterium]|nr:hypothetical protein [bacterium]
MKQIKIICLLFAIALAAVLIPAQASAAARMSGKIVAIKGSTYTIELDDGSKININLKSDAKKLTANGPAIFTVGSRAVFNVISALNDDPLLADSIMDSLYASQNSNKAYRMARNTNIGGFATTAGPAATVRHVNNPVGQTAAGGTKNLTPGIQTNAPFTATPFVMNSPAIGTALTNGGSNPMPSGINQDAMGTNGKNSPLSPLAPQSPSGMFEQGQMQSYDQSIQSNPTMNLSTGGALDPASLITGSKMNSPQSMMQGGDASMLFNGKDDDEEDDDDSLEALNPANMQAGGTPAQTMGRVMSCALAKGVIFYMTAGAPGSQDLGTAIITSGTMIMDGRTGSQAPINAITPGLTVRIDGVLQNGSIKASRITIMQ